VQFLQWVQHGCSAVPAAAAQALLRHRETFSRKSSTRRKAEGAGSEPSSSSAETPLQDPASYNLDQVLEQLKKMPSHPSQ